MFYKDPRKGPLKYYDDTNDAKLWRRHVEILLNISCDLDQGPLTPAMWVNLMICLWYVTLWSSNTLIRTIRQCTGLKCPIYGRGGGRGSGIRAYNVHNKSKNMPRSPLIIPLDPLPRENYVELKEGVNIYHFTLDQRIGYFLSIFFY